MRRALTFRRVIGGVCTAAALVVAVGVTPAVAAQAGVQSAVLGTTCEGTLGGVEKFTIVSDGGIPAGSTWIVSTSVNPSPYTFKAAPDSPLVQATQRNQSSVNLKALAAIPHGTVVKVTPQNFYTTSVLTISGYGGTVSSAPWC